MTTFYTPPRWHVELTMAEDAIHAKLEVRGKLSDQAELDEVVRALLASRPLLASAIEAREGQDSEVGLIGEADESAVPQGDAP